MKKIFLFVLSLFLIFSVSACSNVSEKKQDSESEVLSLLSSTENIDNLHDETIMERAMNEIMRKEYNISNDIEISHTLINTAQQTLSDLDKSIDELSMLVENLRHQSLKLSKD